MQNQNSDVAAHTDEDTIRQQALLDFAVLQSPAVFYIAALDGDMPIRFISANVEALTGHKVSAFLEDPKYGRRFIHPEDLPAYNHTLDRLREQGALSQEYRFAALDGEYRYFRDELRLIRQDDREEFVGCMIDVTETVKAQKELRRSRETLEDAIESLSEGFVLYDSDDRLVLCNSQYKEFHSGSEDLFVQGASWPEITRERAERGLFQSAVGRVDEWLEGQIAQRGTAQNEEFEFPGGRWFEFSHRATRQGGFVSTWRDITERKEMEQALRQSEDLVRRVLEACPVPITMNKVEDGVIIYESPAAQALLKYDRPQDGTSVISRWASEEDRQAYLEDLRKAGAVDGREIRYKKADGEEFWCALSSRLIDYRGEEAVVSNLYDLTERKTIEAEMAQQREMLHQSEKLSALGELLAGVSHELNNPLTVVVGQALLLKETAKDERIIERAESITEAADRCSRIVKSFLAMASQEPNERQPTDVNELVESALEVTSYTLRSSDVDVSHRFAKGLPKVMVDPDQIRQVIINLLVNAEYALQEVKGERKLRITTSFSRQAGLVVIKVKDNGPGIPDNIRNRIFEPLFTTKKVGVGTGIGLAMCHRIIDTHGGAIELESSAGEGATFAIRLPVPTEDVDSVPPDSESPERTVGHSILIIDDEPEVAELLADILRSDGHSVTIANSGREALDRISRARFDMLLSDLRMPDLDGPGLFGILEEREPRLVSGIGFVTGDTMSAKIKEFLKSSGRPYIEKPITPKEVRDLVAEIERGNKR